MTPIDFSKNPHDMVNTLSPQKHPSTTPLTKQKRLYQGMYLHLSGAITLALHMSANHLSSPNALDARAFISTIRQQSTDGVHKHRHCTAHLQTDGSLLPEPFSSHLAELLARLRICAADY